MEDSEFEKISRDIRDFNSRIKTWDFNELSDEEADEVTDLLNETMELLDASDADDLDDDEEI